ncbi:MAG: MFS transporter, partial [Thaumarchaeota archaeon]|nr:MFS transporter [Nitrososphaerota archaeon]
AVGGALAGFILPLVGVSFGLQASFIAAGVLVMLGSAFLLGYIEVENRQSTSLDFLRQGLVASLKNHKLVSTGSVGFFFATVQAAVVTYITLFAEHSLGLGVVISGLFLSLANVSGTIGRPVFGIISDRLLHGDRVKDLLVIAMISGSMLLLISVFPSNGSILVLIPIVAVLGPNPAPWPRVFLTLSGEYSGEGYEAVGTSFAFSLAMLGQVIGAPVFGVLIDVTGSFSFSWRLFALLLVSASVVYTLTRRKR